MGFARTKARRLPDTSHASSHDMVQRYGWALFILLFVVSDGYAQQSGSAGLEVRFGPAPEASCSLEPTEVNAHIHVAAARPSGVGLMQLQTAPTAQLEATYVDDCNGDTWPADAITAFERAMEVWAYHIESEVPIRIEARWQELDSGVLGSAAPTRVVRYSEGTEGVKSDTWYPVALASAITGVDIVGEQIGDEDFDVAVKMSCARSDWHFSTASSPGSNDIDFLTVALHEIGHGIGFVGTMVALNDEELAAWGLEPSQDGDPLPVIYDHFAEDGDSNQLIDTTAYESPSNDLYEAVTGKRGGVFLRGGEAVAASDEGPPRVYAPASWNSGSSFSHLDQSTYTETTNALMRPRIDRAFRIETPGPIFCGLLADMGWPLGADCQDLLAEPEEALIVLSQEEIDVGLWSIGGETDVMLSISNQEDASDVLSITVEVTGTAFTLEGSETSFDLQPGEAQELTLTFSPEAAGPAEEWLHIEHNATNEASPLSVPLKGEGKEPPFVAQPIDDRTVFDVEDPFTIPLSDVFEDPAGLALTFTAEATDETVATVSLENGNLVVAPLEEGETDITVTADDERGGTATETFALTVNERLPPVVASPVENREMFVFEDPFSVDLNDVFEDPDDLPLTFAADVSDGDVLHLGIEGSILTVTPLAAGEADVLLRAEDAWGLAAADTFVVTVKEPESVIVRTPIEDRTVLVSDDPFAIDLEEVFEDPQGYPLTFTASADNAGVIDMNLEDSILSIAPVAAGQTEVTVQADATWGGSATEAFTVTVSERHSPVVSAAVDDQQLVLGGEWSEIDLDDVFTSPEGDALTYEATASTEQVIQLSLDGSILRLEAARIGMTDVTVIATDEMDGNVEHTFSVTVDRLVTSVSRAFGDAAEQRSYRLVALPGDAGMPLAETLTGTPGEDWRAFFDNGGASEDPDSYLVEYDGSATFRFDAGRGFWLLSKQPWEVDTILPAVGVDASAEPSIPLHAGWNIISNPLDRDLPWADVQDANGLMQPLWRWDGSFQQATAMTSARSGEAFYVYNDDSARDNLVLPAASAESEPASEPPVIALSARVDGEYRRSVSFFLNSEEERAILAPPPHFEAVSLHLREENHRQPLSGLLLTDHALREGRTFDLSLSAEPGTTVELLLTGIEHLTGEQAVLVEPNTGRRHALHVEPSIRIQAEERTTHLRLLLGHAASTQRADAPASVSLRAPYPNPFTDEVTIEYTIPEPMKVQLEIFDLLGRRVADFANEEHAAGTYEVIWRSNARGGAPLSSGIYLIRLLAGDEVHVRRATLVR